MAFACILARQGVERFDGEQPILGLFVAAQGIRQRADRFLIPHRAQLADRIGARLGAMSADDLIAPELQILRLFFGEWRFPQRALRLPQSRRRGLDLRARWPARRRAVARFPR